MASQETKDIIGQKTPTQKKREKKQIENKIKTKTPKKTKTKKRKRPDLIDMKINSLGGVPSILCLIKGHYI